MHKYGYLIIMLIINLLFTLVSYSETAFYLFVILSFE